MTEVTDFESIDLKTLTHILIKHYGLTSGWYEVVPEMFIASGPVPSPEGRLPGTVLGVKGVTLKEVSSQSPTAVKAGQVTSRRIKKITLVTVKDSDLL